MAEWNKGFFKGATKENVNYTDRFIDDKAFNDFQNATWKYFNVSSGALGPREMRINRNLLNPVEFANYWQTGKHKNHTIHKSYFDPEKKAYRDIDGDGIAPDYYAVDPDGNVVGFNDKYITDPGKGETPYRRAYYNQDRKARENQSYIEALDGMDTIPGWRDIKKMKDNRTSSVWKIIDTYLDAEFRVATQSTKERENICKRILKMIQTTFFDCVTVSEDGKSFGVKQDGVPLYQMKVITESPEFKKLLKVKISQTTIADYIPAGIKEKLVTGMLQLVRGYGNAIEGAYGLYLAANHKNNRITAPAALELYKSIIIKQAANKLYKKLGLTAAEAANNEELFTRYKQELLKEQQALIEKYKTQSYTFDA